MVLQFLRCLRASPSDTDLQDAFLPHIERFSRCKQIDVRPRLVQLLLNLDCQTDSS